MSHTIACMVESPSDPASAVDERRSVRGIQTVLAFTDFSAQATAAVRRAAQLADQHRALLRVVHVVEPPLLTMRDDWAGSPEGRRRIASAKTNLSEHVRSLNGCDSRVGAQVLVGVVVEEILGVADQGGLLVLGARGSSPVKSVLLGSTATRLLTRCERPMLVVKQDRTDPYGQVLIPIDLQDDATKTLQAALALAPAAQLHVLHAYRVEHEGMFRRADVAKETLQKFRRIAKVKAQSRLLSALARVEQGTPRFLSHLRRDHPVRLTLASEARFHADLIVMSKRSRSRVEDALLGSTTKRVLLDSRCDVLVIPLLATA